MFDLLKSMFSKLRGTQRQLADEAGALAIEAAQLVADVQAARKQVARARAIMCDTFALEADLCADFDTAMLPSLADEPAPKRTRKPRNVN